MEYLAFILPLISDSNGHWVAVSLEPNNKLYILSPHFTVPGREEVLTTWMPLFRQSPWKEKMPRACLTTKRVEGFQELQEEKQSSLSQLNLKPFQSRGIFSSPKSEGPDLLMWYKTQCSLKFLVKHLLKVFSNPKANISKGRKKKSTFFVCRLFALI